MSSLVWCLVMSVLISLLRLLFMIVLSWYSVRLIWWLVIWFCGKLYVWMCFEWLLELIRFLCVVVFFVCCL